MTKTNITETSPWPSLTCGIQTAFKVPTEFSHRTIVPRKYLELSGSKWNVSSTSPHMWLADGDSLMCCIVRMSRLIA